MASIKLFAVVLVCLIPSVFSFWTPCAVGRPPISVTSPLCDAERCRVVRGEGIEMTVTADFTATHHTMVPRATVLFAGISIVIPNIPGHDNFCLILERNGVRVGCPAIPNAVHTWTMNLIVPNTIPAFNNGRVRVEVLDGGQVINCYEAIGQMI